MPKIEGANVEMKRCHKCNNEVAIHKLKHTTKTTAICPCGNENVYYHEECDECEECTFWECFSAHHCEQCGKVF